MKALSIRQPWAWLIIHGGKGVENRCWDYTPQLVGTIYIHASKGMTRDEYEEAKDFAEGVWRAQGKYIRELALPHPSELERGGIIGTAEIVGYTHNREFNDPWYMGELGILLRDQKPCEFRPVKGMLGFFEVP